MHNKGGSRIFALIASVTALQVTGFVLLDQQRGGAGLASRKAWQWSAARSTRTMEAPPLPPVEQQEATAPPFAHSVYLPLRDSAWSNDHRQKMEAILRDIAGSTAFFVDPVVAASNDHAAVAWYWACQIPAFGDACSLRLDLQLATSTNTPPRLVLSMPGHDTPSRADEDFGWLCTKFYEYYDELDAVVDCSAHLLDRVLVQHSNCDAATFAWSAAQLASFERMLQHGYGRKNDRVDDAIRCFIDHLETFGYSIIDCDPSTTPTPTTHDQNDAAFTLHTTAAQQSQLSDYYLHEASSQGPTVRTDRVHFLSRSEAESCGIAAQYDLLMGLAHLLNDHLPSSPRHSSPYLQPVFPATVERPLALPRSLQFAEYAHGDYYVVRT
jgi:hypothetical protein